MKPVIIIAITFVLLIPITVDAISITDTITITILRSDNATDKFNFALELTPLDEEFMTTIARLPDPERETLAISTTEKCDYILDVEEFSDNIKSVYADCVKDKTVIELMSSPNFHDYIGWILAVGFGGFAIWAYFRRR